MAAARRWSVRLTATAEADFRDILRWTTEQFSEQQARAYATTLSSAVEALAAGPSVIGVSTRDDVAPGLFSLHVARQGHKGRHFVMFRIGRQRDRHVIEILRILHDAMDLPRHLPPSDELE